MALGEASHLARRVLHRVRIGAKRLRYLLEPLLAELAPARSLVDLLKRLQDALGCARDLDLLAERVAALGARAERRRLRVVAGAPPASPSPGGRAGRIALARRIGAERTKIGREVEREWLRPRRGNARALAAAIAALARALAAPLTPADRPAPMSDA
jgi:hypothetical protein